MLYGYDTWILTEALIEKLDIYERILPYHAEYLAVQRKISYSKDWNENDNKWGLVWERKT